MRSLPIAYGSSCFSKQWSNKSATFDELCARLKNSVRTSETVKEYPKLPKDERDRAKDKGGFVGGILKGGRRKRETLVCRSMLTLDLDHADKDFISRYEMLYKYTSCLYTTHGHTPSAPRIRIVVPLSRDISPDEYVAITRYFAKEWGIDYFDSCSYRPHQLMYWPTTPSDGEYIFKRFDGEWLDPDAYLKPYPNWRDLSQLPTSSKESVITGPNQKHQQDPLNKSGLVGAFCKAYTISDVIETFLKDVYEPSAMEGRYDYTPADSSAGVAIYDDKFAYSHHATDPASGSLLNAFDLVRIHRFGDEKSSFKEMQDFASKDERVKKQVLEERLAEANMEFKPDGDWRDQLKYESRSTLLANSVWNEMLILNNDPDFANFAYNELARQVEVRGEIPWTRPKGMKFWRDADTAHLKAILDIKYGVFSSRNHEVSFAKVVDERSFHPIREWLDNLPGWDGIERIDTLLVDKLEADDIPYVRAATRKTLCAAVARIYRPGTKFDSVLVLDGEQGIGKSTLFKDLVGEEYYSDTLSLTDMDDKSGAEKLQGFWVIEIGELSGMKKADIERVKAFISTSDDKYRPSYGRTVESHPRQCIIIGSVNGERGYLRDITGNRRFWVVKLRQKEQKKKWTITDEERQQIWAEAKHYWKKGEKLYLDDGLIDQAREAQREAMEVDDRQGIVEEYLERLLPQNWDAMDLYRRRDFLSSTDDPTQMKGTVKREFVSNVEIWCECFGKSKSELKPADSYSIAAIMVRVEGWERTNQNKKIPIYGRQRLYQRI